MNTMVLGLPRNGKGLYSVQMVLDEMRLGKRPVITNLAIEKLPWETADFKLRHGMASYLNRKYESDFNCKQRIFRISDDAVKNFYLYRCLTVAQIAKLGDDHLKGYRAVTLADGVMDEREFAFHTTHKLFVADHVLETDKKGRSIVQSYDARLSQASGGHLNCADECWRFWAARSWQSTSDADVFYNAQHGKFGDDNLFITHRHNDIDSVIVDRCQESVVLTHNGKMNWGKFRRRDNYTAATYAGRPMPSKEPMSSVTFTLDREGIGGCYDTSAGVGVVGRGAADIGGRRKKGLPMWLLPVVVLAGLAVVIYGLKFGATALVGIFTHKPKLPSEINQAAATSHGKTMAVNKADSSSAAIDANGETNRPPVVVCTGFMFFGKSPVAFFSDGRTVDESSGLQSVERGAVTVSGVRWPVVAGKAYAENGYPEFDSSGSVVQVPAAELPAAGITVTHIGQARRVPMKSHKGFASPASFSMSSPASGVTTVLSAGVSDAP